jgi:DNA invertase Pin-like site-specific DNA recombinase
LDRQGAGLGVQRQIEDCERLARDRGLQIISTYSDNDISAYSGKRRPGYQQLLDDLRAGLVDVVITWHADRLHRSPRELEEWIEVSEAHGVITLTVRAGELDLTTAAGRMVARMLGAAARHESEQKSERVSRARQQAAMQGRHHGKLGYGYRSDGTIDEAQALIVREVADRLLAGETLHSVATDLNSRAVPSPGGAAWRTGNMRVMVMRGALCGWREWRVGGRGRGSGELVAEGDWPPILERVTTEQLRALLEDPSRRRGRVAKFLLSNILVCGRCGGRMNGSIDGQSARYSCTAQPGLDRCGRCTVVAEPVERLVVEALLAVLAETRLARVGSAATQKAQARAVTEMDGARRRLEELAEDYASDRISRSEWLAARRVAMERVEAAQGSFALPRHEAVLAEAPANRQELGRWWDEATLEKQRSIAKALIERVVVRPAGKQRNRFDPSRIEPPIWRA